MDDGFLQQRFVRVARSRSRAPAVVDPFLGKRLSHGRLLGVALGLADRVGTLGDAPLGIMLPNGVGAVLGVLGAALAGVPAVMINYSVDAGQAWERARRRVGCRHLLTSGRFCDKLACGDLPGALHLEEWLRDFGPLRRLKAAVQASLPASWSARRLERIDPARPLVILFTSGSEREPKIVPLTCANLAANIEAVRQRLHISGQDRFMSILPFFHVFGFNVNLWLPLLAGATLVTWPRPLEFKAIAGLVRAQGVTLLAATPSMLWGLARAAAPGDLASLRLVISGADRLPVALRQFMAERHGLDIVEGYGATECSPVIAVNAPEDNRHGSVGRPLPGVEVMIAALEGDARVRAGETGRILVRGDSVMAGYLHSPEATAACMAGGWYDTGDLGSLDAEGYLWHRGRRRRFVKVGGEMVSLAAVEEALGSLLPAQAECCVVDLPDERKGARLVAVVSRAVDEARVRASLVRAIGPLAVPAAFLVRSEIPHLGNGKIDLRQVREWARRARC